MGRRYVWGSQPAPESGLRALLPPPAAAMWRPDEHGMAYLEALKSVFPLPTL